MKKKSTQIIGRVIVFTLFLNSTVFAQDNIYTSMYCSDHYVSIELIYDGDNVTAIRKSISEGDQIKSSFYNLAGFGTTDGKKFIAPGSGTYWIIPFGGGDPLQTAEEICIDCICVGGQGPITNGYCTVVNGGGGHYVCGYQGCLCCEMHVYFGDCGGEITVGQGGGILLSARQVTIIER